MKVFAGKLEQTQNCYEFYLMVVSMETGAFPAWRCISKCLYYSNFISLLNFMLV